MSFEKPERRSDTVIPMVLVSHMDGFSIFPLIRAYKRFGRFSLQFANMTGMGEKTAEFLCWMGVIYEKPKKVRDIYFADLDANQHWQIMYDTLKACDKQSEKVEIVLNKYFHESSSNVRELLKANVIKLLQNWLANLLLQIGASRRMAQRENITSENLIIISPHVSLLQLMGEEMDKLKDVCLIGQPFKNKLLPFSLGSVFISLLHVFRGLISIVGNRSARDPRFSDVQIGQAAAWGFEGRAIKFVDDLFWWRDSNIPGSKIVYFYERPEIQPNQMRVENALALGIQSVALEKRYLGDSSAPLIKNGFPKSFRQELKGFFLACRLAGNCLWADEISASILSILNWQVTKAENFSRVFKAMNLKAVFHHQETGLDYVSLAAEFSDMIRFGTQWSTTAAINDSTVRTHQVYFLWGPRDAKMVLDSKSVSKHLLISGCMISDYGSLEYSDWARQRAEEMRQRGVKCILALFDSGSDSPNFYRFFLDWLVEDPGLALFVKSKGGMGWEKSQENGLGGLVQKAKVTGRLHFSNPKSSPSDTALAADFSIGILSISALVVSALKGARVLFLDYEKIDQEPMSAYGVFHSLGPNRCVFYSEASLKKAIQEYIQDPGSNPELGDASPVLDSLDPFRDGQAGRRMGEYMEWYLQGLDQSLDRETALRQASRNYADKWGEDKVVRGL